MKKKRWWPKPGRKFWFIDGNHHAGFYADFYWAGTYFDPQKYLMGVYKSEDEAEAMIKKLKALVEKELGK